MTRYPGRPEFDRFVEPARLKPQAWRLIVGIVLALAIYIGLFAIAGGLVYLRYGAVIAYGVLTALSTGLTAGGVMMLLYSFVGLTAGTITVTRALHGRSAATLFGASFGTLSQNFVRAVVAVLAVNAVAIGLSVAVSDDITANAKGWGLAAFYPFALIGLLIQVSAEEVFFRGYMVQQLAARYASRVVWTGVPAVAFAIGHYAPQDYGSIAWIVVLWAGLFGILATDLTVRTGNLGAAIGFHFASNAVSLFVLGIKGNMDGLALWTTSVDYSTVQSALPIVLTDFLTIVVCWLATRLALRV